MLMDNGSGNGSIVGSAPNIAAVGSLGNCSSGETLSRSTSAKDLNNGEEDDDEEEEDDSTTVIMIRKDVNNCCIIKTMS